MISPLQLESVIQSYLLAIAEFDRQFKLKEARDAHFNAAKDALEAAHKEYEQAIFEAAERVKKGQKREEIMGLCETAKEYADEIKQEEKNKEKVYDRT